VIAFNILNIGRFKLGAMCVGGGRVVLESANRPYAKQRKAFGKAISDFGLVREKSRTWQPCSTSANRWCNRTVG